jgi:glutathione S-transferase
VTEKPTIIGRSSSHFTRIARIFAIELGVDCHLRIVPDLGSLDVADYGGNPALKIPSLIIEGDTWFGAANVCRELARRSSRGVVWPEAHVEPLLANAHELTLHAMSTEVGLIMAARGGVAGAHVDKMRASLENVMVWLDERVESIVSALPAGRDLSFLEVALFCLVEHLEWRKVLSTEPFARLRAFEATFGERASAKATPFFFDAVGT